MAGMGGGAGLVSNCLTPRRTYRHGHSRVEAASFRAVGLCGRRRRRDPRDMTGTAGHFATAPERAKVPNDPRLPP